MQPKVSVIIPIYNNERYLRECLDSAVGQTLRDIEIICVNDGSTDGSLAVMREYEASDPRIKVIDKPNGGYGQTMNCGLAAATGEYVAFLESDDSINLSAYEKLAKLADEYSLDIVKGDYFNLEGMGDQRVLEPVAVMKTAERYGKVFRPLEEAWSFYVPMMNCLGLFRRSMLEEYGIRHNETPGAAHQDMGFWFQTLCCADSMMFTNEPFYEYRQDNMNASMKSDKTTFSTLDEYAFIHQFLERYPAIEKAAMPIFYHRKFGSSLFSYGRAELSLRLPFLRQLAAEYRDDLEQGGFAFERFSDSEREQLEHIMADPDEYYLQSLGVEDSGEKLRLAEEVASVRLQLQRLQANKQDEALASREMIEEDAVDLSVIVPVYNAADYIEECLASIFAQELPSYEVICIDDGSEDGSLQLIEKLVADHLELKVVSQQNQGQGAARNVGLGLARGRYVQFVDSDDRLPSEGIDEALEKMKSDNLDVLFFDGTTFYENEELAERYESFKETYHRDISHDESMTGIELFKRFKKEGTYRVSPCLALFRRNLLDDQGIRFPEGIIYEDNAFALKVICTAQRAAHINRPLYLRRIREGSTMTAAPTAKNARSYFLVYLDMLQFALRGQWDYATDAFVADELKSILGRVRSIYRKLDDAERMALRTLPPVQESVLDSSIAQIVEQMRREEAEKEAKKYKNQVKKLKASNSWKVGRKITAPVRLLKRLGR